MEAFRTLWSFTASVRMGLQPCWRLCCRSILSGIIAHGWSPGTGLYSLSIGTYCVRTHGASIHRLSASFDQECL